MSWLTQLVPFPLVQIFPGPKSHTKRGPPVVDNSFQLSDLDECFFNFISWWLKTRLETLNVRQSFVLLAWPRFVTTWLTFGVWYLVTGWCNEKTRNYFLSNLTLATLLNILLIQIVISWFLLQNAWIRHFSSIFTFFFSPKSRQIAALRIVIFCPCYWIRHLIRPHDWHAEKKCKNSIFVKKRQYLVIILSL